MRKFAYMIFGALAYLMFFGTITYAIGFVGGYVVPKDIDDGIEGPIGLALLINLGLLALFGIQHSVMARPAFKRRWTKIVPKPIERSTYVLLSSAILMLAFWAWRPIGDVVWQIDNPAAAAAVQVAYFVGWGFVFGSSFIINHFELFGLKQVIDHCLEKQPDRPTFVVRYLYRLVRHPLMLGFLIVMWSAPVMTLGHLVWALGTTAYIFVALRLEERDLVSELGDAYRRYQEAVPMVIPFTKGARIAPPVTARRSLRHVSS